MKKIGLTTIYSVPNYGSVLQAFASQEILKKIGYDCYIIDYKYPNEWHYKHGTPKAKLISKIALSLGLKRHHRKSLKLNAFKKKYFNFTSLYKNLNELENSDWRSYDLIIVGSDQVWNPKFVKGDTAFMLSYLPNSIKRISLASSFACSFLPEKYITTYKKYLSRFDYLSVREENGVNILHNELNINKDIKILLDPTLLLSKEDWTSLVPRSKFKKKKPYILFYMLDYAFDPKPYIFNVIQYFAKSLNYEIIILEGYIPKYLHEKFNVITKNDASVEEYIDLFQYANLVITSSFHGTAFAVNFGIPLISIIPQDKGDDRQSTLLKSIGLEQCIIKKGTEFETIHPFYDANIEQQKLNDKRQDSLNWLTRTINSLA